MLTEADRHAVRLYRIPSESYGVVAEALLWTLDYGLGEAFTPEVRAAWTRLHMQLAVVGIDDTRLGTEAPSRGSA